MKVQRFDRGELVPAHETEEGFLYFDGRASRAGVFIYRRADGTIQRELRPPEEVGAPDSLASLARKPVTDLHPKEFVDAANVEKFGVGIVDAEVVWEQDFKDGFVRVKGTVQRKDAVDSIRGGRRELSAGYTADLEMTSGVWKDASGREHKFDAIQRRIRYNHLALVDRGRAGPLATLRADAAIQTRDETHETEPQMKIRIDGREYDAAEASAIQRAVSDLETSRKDSLDSLAVYEVGSATLNKRIDALEIENAELKAKTAELDVLKADLAKRTDSADEVEKQKLDWANERFELVDMARGLKLDGFDAFGTVEASNADIKRAIVLSRFDEADVPSEPHIDAALSLMKKDAAAPPSEPSTQPLADALTRQQRERADAGGDPIADAQKAYNDRMRGITQPSN